MTQSHCYDWPRPAMTADIVVFDVSEPKSSVLLIQRARPPFQGQWALPGGFLDQGETVEACAARELAEETGLRATDLGLVGIYSAPGRDPRGWTVTAAFWMRRTTGSGEAVAADDAAAVRWFALDDLPTLAFDHARIIADAWSRHSSTAAPEI